MTTTESAAAEYEYRVTWSVEDDEFVATCAEFPSLSWLAGEPAEALAGITALVSDVLDDMRSSGECPRPLASRLNGDAAS